MYLIATICYHTFLSSCLCTYHHDNIGLSHLVALIVLTHMYLINISWLDFIVL